MMDILRSVGCWGLCVFCHISWCRQQTQKEKLRIASFLSIGAILLTAYIWSWQFYAYGSEVEQKADFWLMPLRATSVVIYVLLCGCYLIFYHLTIVDSPTRKILHVLNLQAKCTWDDLARVVTDKDFIQSRLEALVEHRMVKWEGGFYHLTPLGHKIAKAYIALGYILHREKGG
jgi:hypothetical protein